MKLSFYNNAQLQRAGSEADFLRAVLFERSGFAGEKSGERPQREGYL